MNMQVLGSESCEVVCMYINKMCDLFITVRLYASVSFSIPTAWNDIMRVNYHLHWNSHTSAIASRTKLKAKVSVWNPDIHVTTRVLQTLPPLAVGAQQPATIDPTLDPTWSNLGGPMWCGIQSLPDTSMHGQHWESNPRPSDLESNTLSTWPHDHTRVKCP